MKSSEILYNIYAAGDGETKRRIMNIGDTFETNHESKWIVCKVNLDGSFEAKSSDGIAHAFNKDGNFVRENYEIPHPYDFKRAWSEREQEDLEKAALDKILNEELEKKRKAESEWEIAAQMQMDAETKERRLQAKKNPANRNRGFRLPR